MKPENRDAEIFPRTRITEDDYNKRKKTIRWQNQQNIVSKLLEEITAKRKLTVLDIPVGTGRFFDIYNKLSLR